jgi:hypothetical protein
MTIGSLLVSLTATTLALAAFSPHAAEAGDFPSFSFMKFRSESMRPELESYVSGISSAKRKNVTTIAQASGKIAPETPEISATATPPSKNTCLTKEYLATGAVLFKDTCTKQWAINSTTVARHKPAGRACLSKEVSDDGIVIFRDTCTNEWAMNSSQNPADPPR